MHIKQHTRPIWLATLIAPWAAPIGLALWATATGLVQQGSAGLKDWPSLFLFLFFVLPASYAATCLFGLPYVLWLRARKALNTVYVCMGAGAAGVITAFAYPLVMGSGWAPNPITMLLSIGLGLLSGLSFCFVAGITFRPSGRAKKPRAA
jgi:hypothetical protein